MLADAFGRLIWPESGQICSGRRRSARSPEINHWARHCLCLIRRLFLPRHGARQPALRPQARTVEGASYEGERAVQPRMGGRRGMDGGQSRLSTLTATGSTTRPPMRHRPTISSPSILSVLDTVQLSKDILDLALRTTINPEDHPAVAEGIVEMRHALRDELEDAGLSSLVASFEPGAYNMEATVGENLLFGTATGPTLVGKAIAKNAYFRSVVGGTGLDRILFRHGLQHRRERRRTVRRPAARPSVLPAAHLHDGGRYPDLSVSPAEAARPGLRRGVRGRALGNSSGSPSSISSPAIVSVS